MQDSDHACGHAGDNGPWMEQGLSGGSEGLFTGEFSGYWNTGKVHLLHTRKANKRGEKMAMKEKKRIIKKLWSAHSALAYMW